MSFVSFRGRSGGVGGGGGGGWGGGGGGSQPQTNWGSHLLWITLFINLFCLPLCV